MRRFRPALFIIFLIVAAGALPRAQNPAPAAPAGAAATVAKLELSVDSIMRGPALVGWPPTNLRWSADSRRLFFSWRKPGDDESATYVVNRDGGDLRKLSDDEARHAPPANARWDDGRRRALATAGGDVVLHDGGTGRRRHITRTAGAESRARWARGGTHVTFVSGGNLFIVPVESNGAAAITQLTRVAPRTPEPRLNASQQFIRDEELKLLDAVRTRAEKREKAEQKAKQDELPPFELQDRQTAVDLMLSPDDTHVFILVAERPAGAKTTIVPSYVTESGYTEDIPSRSLVGDTQSRTLLAVLNIETGKSVWADASFAPPVPADERAPAATAAADAKAGDTPPPGRRAGREVRWAMPVTSPDGRYVVAGARSADNKERWFVTLDPASGRTKVIDVLHDEAWVRESTFGGSIVEFLPDGRRIAFLSDRDGWMHLYTLDVTDPSAKPAQLTSGRWEVESAELSGDAGRFYLTTSEVHPGERHLYTMPIDGGPRTRITTMSGANEGTVAPDDGTVAIVHSYSNRPPEVYLMANRPGAAAHRVTTTPTAEWRAFNWIDPRVVTYKARDGVDVHARLFTPEMIGARRDRARPAVVFVHGAGYLQNAHRYWSTYFREYMFHNLLAARGYVVLDVDYRASAGYGRDWRTAIYRHMGGKDLEDVVDGAKYLADREGVNPRRIGVYGGSYGGFITLMAMFTTPDVFAAGAALRPVSDWARYNHGYTSNILNAPQDDAEAYRRSSPIYFAAGLKGALLICHGMVDVNVHFQDSVRLAQRLIELRKENWELAVYPVEDHEFSEETSWADEYKRILRLFEDNLRNARDEGNELT